MTAGKGPLAGIRIVDLSALAPGPFATMLLGDLGADVITVEPPATKREGSGLEDLPYLGGAQARELGINPLFRSRRSIVVDLKSEGGKEAVLELASQADVCLEGFRPGTCDRLGLGYDDVRSRNPAIVYCSLSGYGQGGELAQRAGHDLNYLAESGLLSTTTRPGQRPGIPVNAVADFAAGGLLAAFGIVAALQGRSGTGRGCYVDVSMYEGLLGLLQAPNAWTVAGAPDPSWGAGMLSGAVPFYDCYQTADDRWLSVAALEPKFYVNLCEAIGRPELNSARADPERWPQVRHAFEEAFASDTLAGWLRRLEDVDTAVAPVRSIAEAFAAGRQAGFVTDDTAVGPLPRMVGWDATRGEVVTHPGAHTREVLAEAGLTPGRIDELLASGAVADWEENA